MVAQVEWARRTIMDVQRAVASVMESIKTAATPEEAFVHVKVLR
jgi:hypothetical protein